MRIFLSALLAFVLSVTSAIAQTPNVTGNTFQTGQAGKTVQGVVDMCVNGSNVAVPCGTGGTGQAVTQATSPWVTSSVSTNVNKVVTPTVAASSHVSGSSVGGLQTIAFFRANSSFSGIVNNVKWAWKTGSNLTAVTIYLFSANPTASTCTDATALTLNAADVSKQIAGSPFVLSPAVIGAGSTVSSAYAQSAISVQNADGTPGVNLYACVVVNATVTPAANDGVLNVAGLTD